MGKNETRVGEGEEERGEAKVPFFFLPSLFLSEEFQQKKKKKKRGCNGKLVLFCMACIKVFCRLVRGSFGTRVRATCQ